MTQHAGPEPLTDARLRAAYARRPQTFDAHPDDARWAQFACGELTADDRAALADHVTRCAMCADVYRAVTLVVNEAPAFDPRVPASAPGRLSPPLEANRPWYLRPELGVAAVFVLAVGGVSWFLAQPSVDVPRAGVDAAASAGPAPSAPSAPAEAQRPVYRLALSKPDVTLPSDLIVVMRAPAGATPQPFLEEFGQAIAPYRADRFAEAAVRLLALTARYPERAEVWFYLGMSQLLDGRPGEALDAFARAGDGGSARAELPWQRAVALERAGRGDEATRALTALCAQAGSSQARACGALRASPPATP